MRRLTSRYVQWIGFAILAYDLMYRISFRFRSATELKIPRSITSRWIFENQISTWFSHEEYVGVKCSRTFGLAFKNSSTFFVLCADRLSRITWISCAQLLLVASRPRKSTNSWEVWRGAVLPSTCPLFTSRAAYHDSVPCR